MGDAMKVCGIIVFVVVLGACAGPAVPPDAVATFEAGAAVDWEKHRVCLASEKAQELIKLAPAEFKLCGQETSWLSRLAMRSRR